MGLFDFLFSGGSQPPVQSGPVAAPPQPSQDQSSYAGVMARNAVAHGPSGIVSSDEPQPGLSSPPVKEKAPDAPDVAHVPVFGQTPKEPSGLPAPPSPGLSAPSTGMFSHGEAQQEPDVAHVPTAEESKNFFSVRGGHNSELLKTPLGPKLRITSQPVDPATLNPHFAKRLEVAITAAEAATGDQVRVGEMYRNKDVQAVYYRRYISGQGGLAAPPGRSRHQVGEAADLQPSAAGEWLHQHAEQYGLEFLKGHSFTADPWHIQMKRDFQETSAFGG